MILMSVSLNDRCTHLMTLYQAGLGVKCYLYLNAPVNKVYYGLITEYKTVEKCDLITIEWQCLCVHWVVNISLMRVCNNA